MAAAVALLAGLAAALALTAGSAWDSHDSWASADLDQLRDLAMRSGLALRITGTDGRTLLSVSESATTGPESTAAIVAGGQRRGEVVVRFTKAGLGAADKSLRTALLRAIDGAAGLAALLALVTGLVVARVLQAGHEALLDGVAEPTPEELSSLRDEVLRLARMVGDLQTLADADADADADAAALHLPGTRPTWRTSPRSRRTARRAG